MADYQLADQYLLDASKREDVPVEVSRGKKWHMFRITIKVVIRQEL